MARTAVTSATTRYLLTLVIHSFQHLPRNVRGAAWMIVSSLLFTCMTTLIKYLGTDYPATVQNFYRQLAGLLVLGPLILRDPRSVFRTTRPGLLLFRCSVGSLANILAFYCYQKAPLAEANVLSFTRVLWIVPLAAFLLHERIGPRRIAATLIGFIGVVIIARPSGHTSFSWAMASGLLSAFLFSFTITGLKVLTRDHTPATLMAWSASLGLLFSIPPAFVVWQWPSPYDLMLLVIMGALGTITQWCYIRGLAVGDAAVMVSMDYVRLPLALFVGYSLFGDIPTGLTLLGAGIVIAATLYISFREMRLGAAKRSTYVE